MPPLLNIIRSDIVSKIRHIEKKSQDWNDLVLIPCTDVDKLLQQNIVDSKSYYEDMVILCGRGVSGNFDGALSNKSLLETLTLIRFKVDLEMIMMQIYVRKYDKQYD